MSCLYLKPFTAHPHPSAIRQNIKSLEEHQGPAGPQKPWPHLYRASPLATVPHSTPNTRATPGSCWPQGAHCSLGESLFAEEHFAYAVPELEWLSSLLCPSPWQAPIYPSSPRSDHLLQEAFLNPPGTVSVPVAVYTGPSPNTYYIACPCLSFPLVPSGGEAVPCISVMLAPSPAPGKE